MKRIILLVAIAGMAGLPAFAGQMFKARLSSVAIEGGIWRNRPTDARKELELHLSVITGGSFSPARDDAELTIVLGQRAPGEGEPSPHTSYAKLVGDRLYLWGDDSKERPGTLFAVYGFLERNLGVLWTMPGDDNIIVPRAAAVSMPANWSWRYRPPLKSGMMRGGSARKGLEDVNSYLAPKQLRRSQEQIDRANADILRWKLRHKMYSREPMPFGHAFTEWNDRYLETHPEYLALQANGKRGIAKPGTFDAHCMKLCVSNEDVVDLIVAEYVKAGKPKYYNICPNDGFYFCRCEKCKALDCPVTEDERNWKTEDLNLADRYINFWNRIARKIVAIRPDAMLDTYLYSCYRNPSRRERIEYPDNMCFGMVPSQEDDNLAQIRAWKARGMKHFKLRPNYLCYRSWIPRGYERFFLDNFKMNFREGMIGTDYDGTPRGEVTAFEYYTVARALQDPDVSFEQVEREFLSQYGKAAPKMKVYFDRVRERNEKALFAKQRYNAGDKEFVLDDSHLAGTVVWANPVSELEKDEAILKEALGTPGLSEVELRRVRAMAVLPRHAILTREFKLAFKPDGEVAGTFAPDFAEKGLKLMDYRINVLQPVITPINWGPTFRNYPFEIRYWRQKPIKGFIYKKYPEMGRKDR